MWCVVRGAWCVVRGAWCVVRGAWLWFTCTRSFTAYFDAGSALAAALADDDGGEADDDEDDDEDDDDEAAAAAVFCFLPAAEGGASPLPSVPSLALSSSFSSTSLSVSGRRRTRFPDTTSLLVRRTAVGW